MARPSLKEKRTVEILDAFAICVSKYGLAGSTLERISETAGVKRPILRHYLGNREEMVRKLIDHVIDGFNARTDTLFSILPRENRWQTLLDYLFYMEGSSPVDAAVYQALIAASGQYPDIKPKLWNFVSRFESAVAREVARAFPKADNDQCLKVAAGVTAIYFNADALAPLNPPKSWLDTHRQTIAMLVDALDR